MKRKLQALVDELELDDDCSFVKIVVDGDEGVVAFSTETSQTENTKIRQAEKEAKADDVFTRFATPRDEMSTAIRLFSEFEDSMEEILYAIEKLVKSGETELFNNFMKDIAMIGGKNYILQVIEK